MSSRKLLDYFLIEQDGDDDNNSTEEYDASEIEDDWEDPCQEFNHSIVFFLTIIAAVVGWLLYGWLLFVR